MELIQSDQNPKFKTWKTLLESKGRKKENLFILSGQKIIYDFIRLQNDRQDYQIKAVIFDASIEISKTDPIFQRSISKKLFFNLTHTLFKDLDVLGTHYPLVILTKPEVALVELKSTPPIGLELVLPLTNPSNLGALIRTGVAFGVSHFFLTTESADPYHPMSLRASSGSVLSAKISKIRLPYHSDDDDWALDMQGIPLQQTTFPKNVRLWLGQEGQGINQNWPANKKISIPIQNVESLNVTVAGSLAIWNYWTHHNINPDEGKLT